MLTLRKHSGHWSHLLAAVVGSLLFFLAQTATVVAQEAPPANLKIAFIGDQGLGPNAVAVLNLIKRESAHAVMHSGDLDYIDDPAAWEAQINSVLGANFPYFVSIGNHDELAWSRPNGYQQFLESRFNRLGISWSGRLGVRSSFHYKGIFFVLTAPGITSGFDEGHSDLYIRDQLVADNSVWSICSWHKNMRAMQIGGKTDETGWGVYEAARNGGAIIATAHEHSYSRTHLLSSMSTQTIASTSNTLHLTEGNTFAFVSGLAGRTIRAQSLTGNWWASAYASTCLQGDPICQPNASSGALFGVFNVDGQPNKALFYFKDINGRVVDQFVVVSDVETFPKLLIEEVTGSAIVLDSVTWLREPFPVVTANNFSLDARTRVVLFATHVNLTLGEDTSVITAQAEDSQNRVFPLTVEFVRKVPRFDWLTQLIVKLPDELINVGEVQVSITVRGKSSNKVPFRVRPSTSSGLGR
ncbi:MAG: metallophosphoesterase [Acidobacteria bacterium]|nr:metallophosphoesterase [Acidobacteriota bacterium]